MSQARFKSSKLHPCWSLLALSAALACSGSTQPAAQVGTDGIQPGTVDTELANTAPDELPIAVQAVEEPAPAATFDGCLSTLSHHFDDAASYAVWTYDPASRVLEEVLSDEHGAPIDVASSSHLYWKLDTAERLLSYAGTGGHSDFRQDTRRDEHGNPMSNIATYVDVLDLSQEQQGFVYSSSAYTNEYDEDGLLTRQNAEVTGGKAFTATYTHDEQDRCAAMSWDDGRAERREYGSDQKLRRREQENWPRGNYPTTYTSALSYERDNLGRLLSVTERFEGETDSLVRLRVEYRDDGSVVEERTVDTDVGDGYSRRAWTPGCAAILPVLLREPKLACEGYSGQRVGDFRIP